MQIYARHAFSTFSIATWLSQHMPEADVDSAVQEGTKAALTKLC